MVHFYSVYIKFFIMFLTFLKFVIIGLLYVCFEFLEINCDLFLPNLHCDHYFAVEISIIISRLNFV